MWSSMNAADAWTPQQSRASLWDDTETIVCPTNCPHIKNDKNRCMLLPTCPKNIPTLLSPHKQAPRKTKPNWNNKCQFPGCGNPCPGKYCIGKSGHAHLVARRKDLYPGMPLDFYHMCPAPIGHNDSLLKKYERLKAKEGI